LTDRVLRVALTGGIATGKSYCAARLAALGARVIDADDLARHAVAPGTAGLSAVTHRFGAGVLHPDGRLNRAALAAIVFSDARARADLEAIVHPVVYQEIRQWFEEIERTSSRPSVAVATIPLLYETDRDGDFDQVIVAVCPREAQIDRLVARDGLTRKAASLRLASQWPIDEKARRADHVIDTSGTFDATDRQVEALWQRLCGDADQR
jgi:dephospho-CoA kinase